MLFEGQTMAAIDEFVASRGFERSDIKRANAMLRQRYGIGGGGDLMAYKDGSKSGGRRAGTPNRKTEERQERAKRAAEEMIRMRGDVGIFSGSSHEFLMSLYQDLAMPVELRADAAKAALRYEAPNTETAAYLVITDKDLEQIEFPPTADGRPRYLVRMPAPVKDLDEWRSKYDPAFKPVAESPERPEQIEGEAKQDGDKQ
jgi:hypothetical protein